VTNGRNGIVVAGYHPPDYAEALRRLAPASARAVVAAANIEDVRRFNVETTGAGYVSVVESFAATQ